MPCPVCRSLHRPLRRPQRLELDRAGEGQQHIARALFPFLLVGSERGGCELGNPVVHARRLLGIAARLLRILATACGLVRLRLPSRIAGNQREGRDADSGKGDYALEEGLGLQR